MLCCDWVENKYLIWLNSPSAQKSVHASCSCRCFKSKHCFTALSKFHVEYNSSTQTEFNLFWYISLFIVKHKLHRLSNCSVNEKTILRFNYYKSTNRAFSILWSILQNVSMVLWSKQHGRINFQNTERLFSWIHVHMLEICLMLILLIFWWEELLPPELIIFMLTLEKYNKTAHASL